MRTFKFPFKKAQAEKRLERVIDKKISDIRKSLPAYARIIPDRVFRFTFISGYLAGIAAMEKKGAKFFSVEEKLQIVRENVH